MAVAFEAFTLTQFRQNGEPVNVLLAAVTLLLAWYTGETEALLRLIVSTRFRPASRGLVGAFNENALFRLDLPLPSGESVGELLHRASDAALLAYAHCEYDPRKLDALFVFQPEAVGR